MKKIVYILTITVFVLTATTAALAVKPNGPSAYNGYNNENVLHLYLYEKVPSGDWPVAEGGAFGKLSIKQDDSFVFNGHGLEAETDYTLIRYPDASWPGPVTCLAAGSSNEYGDIHLSGEMTGDQNKVWLVLTADVDCDSTPSNMIGWNPSEYLFEYNVLP